jgi:hypothetical protein
LIRGASRLVGTCEHALWKPFSWQAGNELLRVARLYNVAAAQPGDRGGVLGWTAIAVFECLIRLIDHETGRLEPSIARIAQLTALSKSTVCKALQVLAAHGFISWVRRMAPTGNTGRGPQVKQATNAYQLHLPEAARRYLRRPTKPPPIPDDVLQARLDRHEALKGFRASLTLSERALLDVGDNPLGQALARLGRAISERESGDRSQYQTPSYSICDPGPDRRRIGAIERRNGPLRSP